MIIVNIILLIDCVALIYMIVDKYTRIYYIYDTSNDYEYQILKNYKYPNL